MKSILLSLLLCSFAGTALALERAELDDRVRLLTAKLDSLQQKPDKRIPADTLRLAHGIILMDRTKAGFLFAYQGGGGVAMVRDAVTKNWSPVAFLGANEASLGFQIGGEQDFYVILIMNTNALKMLTDPNFEFGGEARGTAGDSTSGVGGAVSTSEHPVIIYDDHKGLYGGAAVKGGAVVPDDQANHLYYGQYLTMKEILFDHKVTPGDTGLELAKRVEWHSQIHDDTKTAHK